MARPATYKQKNELTRSMIIQCSINGYNFGIHLLYKV
jgi:hypothetical protein